MEHVQLCSVVVTILANAKCLAKCQFTIYQFDITLLKAFRHHFSTLPRCSLLIFKNKNKTEVILFGSHSYGVLPLCFGRPCHPRSPPGLQSRLCQPVHNYPAPLCPASCHVSSLLPVSVNLLLYLSPLFPFFRPPSERH